MHGGQWLGLTLTMLSVKTQETPKWPPVCIPMPGIEGIHLSAFKFIGH